MDERNATARDQWLLRLANRQFGLLRHSDLVRAGVGRGAIEKRLINGRLTRVHHRVYALGHSVLTAEGRWLAAVWACGDGAILSHTSAAAYHGMYLEENDAPVHVSTPRQARSRPGITIHRVRRLDRADVFFAHPLLVARVPRTVIDIADVLPWNEFRKAADSLPKLHLAKVKEAQDRAPGRSGAPLVTRLIEADDAHTKSEFERKFLRFVKTHSLTRPDDLNYKVAGHKADAVYHRQRLVIELDGRAFHKRRAQMHADRQRDIHYQQARHRVMRLLWDDLHPDQASRTAFDLRLLLGTVATGSSHG